MEIPLTFADFAITENRFRKHFRQAPRDTWNENMVPLVDFLELEEDEREGRFPFVWSVNRKQELTRLLVAKPMVESCEDRRDFWTLLRALAGTAKEEVSRDDIADEVRREVVGRIAANLMQLAQGGGETASAALDLVAAPAAAAQTDVVAADAGGDGMAPWIDTEDCTSCDECTALNPQIFAYDENQKAFIKDASAGPYRDLVKAAERCTAQVIHPGLPRDRSEKDIEKWIARAAKYN